MRFVKFAIYAAITVLGIALAYHRISTGLLEGDDGWAARAPLAVWGAMALYLAGYAFLLAAEAVWDRRHRLAFDVAAFAVFCAAVIGRLAGV